MYTIQMYSKADLAQGHGVLSAYEEQRSLVETHLSDEFQVGTSPHQVSDINHFHTINPEFLYSVWRGKRNHSKNVGYVHFLPETLENSISLPAPIKWLFYKYVLFFYRQMDELVTVNPYFVNVLADTYHFPREHITYIPNFVSSRGFHPLPDKIKLREDFHLPSDKFIVLCAGQLQTRKGIFDFIKIAEEMPELHFAWAGDFSFGKISSDYDSIRHIVENPPKNVSFLGLVNRDNMNALYNACDMMLLPSYEELFPMTILEAMQCEIPILVRDLELYDDILFDYVLYASNLPEFELQIRRLCNDTFYYDAACRKSKNGGQEYSEACVARKWREYYNRILLSHKP